MNKLYLLLLLAIGSSVFGQQKGISYQAVIINPNEIKAPGLNSTYVPLSNKAICLSFQIVNNNNQVEYQESQSVTTDVYGMVNRVIGTGTSGTGLVTKLDAVNWNQGTKKLVVGVNTEGVCSNYTEISNQVLNYTPYSFFAQDADLKDGYVTDVKVAMGINPTKVGLGNVNNTSDANKPISIATQTALDLKENLSNKSSDIAADATSTTKYPTVKAVKDYIDAQNAAAGVADGSITSAKIANATIVNEDVATTAAIDFSKLNIQKSDVVGLGLTQSDIGLTNVDNTSDADKPVSTATQTALDLKANATDVTTSLALKANLVSPTFTGTVSGIDKTMVGLNNVDNTSDANKPVSSATQTALALKANATDVTTSLALKENLSNKSSNIVTDGTSTTKYPTVKAIKDYVDAQNAAAGVADGSITSAKIANATIVNEDVATTAAIDFSKLNIQKSDVVGLGLSKTDIGLTNVDNTSDADKPVSTATQTALNLKSNSADVSTSLALKANIASPTFTGTVSGIDKTMVGLNNVDNTSDANKPVSTATQTALDLKANISSPTFTGTVTAPIYASAPQALTAGATLSWNPANGLNASVTLDQNSTLSFSATPAVGSYGTLVVSQDATGGRTITLPSTSNKVLGSTSTTTITLSSAANAKDILNFYYDGTNCYWNIGQGYGTAATVASTNLASSVSGTLAIANGGTGSTTQNFVDLTTNQNNISGNKTFTNNIAANGINIGKGSGASSTILGNATSANDNSTAIGYMSLNGNGGTNNTAIGTNAMRDSGSTAYTTAIGVIAGQNSNTGNNNTFLGYAASVPNNSAISNATAIGSGAIVTSSNTIQLGADGSNGTTAISNIKTSGTLTAGSITYPNAHGTANQVLSTTGSGTLAWVTPVSSAASLTGTLPVANGGTGASTKTTAFDALSPMTTSGDILYGGTNGSGTRLGRGSNGAILTMENNIPVWLTSIRATAGSTYNAAVGFSFAGGDWARNTGMFSDNPDGGGSATLKFRIATSNSTADSYLEINPSKVSVLPTTASTSKTTGALTVAGGLGVDGNIYSNNLNASGTLTAGAITYPNITGTANQVLTTNGIGVASWVTPSTTATAYSGTLPVTNGGTGQTTITGIQTALGLAGSKVAIGATSGLTSQGSGAVAVGNGTGNSNQGNNSIAIGYVAGSSSQGASSVAIGVNAGQSSQGANSVAIGDVAGQSGQGANSVAIGSNSQTALNSVAIGGYSTSSFANSIAIGYKAATTTANTIQLGGDGVVVGSTAITNVKTSGTLTAGTVTYPNAHNSTAGQLLSINATGTAAWTTPASSGTHTIGESYGGGIVFYTWDGGAHGLIAATTNQSDAVFAGTAGIQTRSTGDGIGAGLKNTSIIIAVNSAVNYSSNPNNPNNPINAATVCNDYSITQIVNGVSIKYGDWYLPSIYELKLMYQNIGKGATGANYNIGGLSAPLLYWASTEAGSTENWQLDPASGGSGSIHKSYTLSVRAIRMF